ncbi:MAG TPA: phosphatase PAP2 family protein [Candidatus Saccharimonadia bacterium]|nr:phosphatase PAP2 family protein [Candidatus Saccharimonadia bacterium]
MHELVIIFAKYVIVTPVLVLAFVFFRLSQRRKLELVAFLVLSVLVTALLAKLGAALHQDPRPFVRDGVIPYFAHGRDNGFPSDHTTYSALIAFVVVRYSRWLGVSLAVVSLTIGMARVIAGVHHGQDIIGGFAIAAVGVSASFLLILNAESFYARRKRTKSVE